jgi:transcriptional regulator with XRE-family HTH domain
MGRRKGETMGNRIQRLRQEAGLSQAQLARAAGIPPGTLKNWEQNLRVPGLRHAVKLALALRTSLDNLAGMNEDPPVEFVEHHQKKAKRKGGEK